MAQTSYLSKMIARFFSSTIGQVGRDLGKTISNQVFGDSHSTPIRHVNNNHKQVTDDDLASAFSRVGQRMTEKKRQKQRTKLWGITLAVIIGLPLGVLLAYLLMSIHGI